MSELSEIKERLTKLETTTTERWDAHDKRSEERWDGLHNILESIDVFMKEAMERRANCMKESKDYTKTMVLLVVGIPTTLASIVGVVIMIHKLVVH